jgi:hypothetical protein
MQQRFAQLAGRMRYENLAAQSSQVFKPRAEVTGQLRIDLATQPLRECRALASC